MAGRRAPRMAPLLLAAVFACCALGAMAQKPCCSDCPSKGNSQDVFNCFADCRQDCDLVSGEACLAFSQDVADRVADVACLYAQQQCGINQQAAKAAFGVTREQCYKAAKNVCITYGNTYAQSGQGSCSYYSTGGGSCTAAQFQQYYNSRLNELCDSVAKGISLILP